MMVWFILFFFFQAEDGIRDIGVTGVQTCALPISFGLFWYTMLASYLMLLAWPEGSVRVELGGRLSGLATALQRLDADGRYRCRVTSVPGINVRVGDRTYAGLAAWARLLVYLPIASMVLVVLVALVHGAAVLVPVALLVLVGLALPPRRETRDQAVTHGGLGATQGGVLG